MRLSLPDVTLLQIDTVDRDRAERVMDRCREKIDFGRSVLLTASEIPHVDSYEAYNRFVICELHWHFDTSHVLLVQHDGFILQPFTWKSDWLNYDYIGAPWYDYGPGRSLQIKKNGVVGNGGFSLRSRKLCELASSIYGRRAMEDPTFFFAPEDQLLCDGPQHWVDVPVRTSARKEMEAAGMKWASPEVASEFSWELHDNDPLYARQFGFHGPHTMERLTQLAFLKP
jgi:hypothetical protein